MGSCIEHVLAWLKLANAVETKESLISISIFKNFKTSRFVIS